MSGRLQIYQKETPIYEIVYERNYDSLLKECGFLNIKDRRVCVITDSKVDTYYGEEVLQIFASEAKAAIKYVFPMGEEHKNLEVVQKIYEFLIQNHFDRKDLLVALGGGVTGDMTGFCAATYLRGIDFIQIPTTLLSQVDSSIGGKTGVDFSCYKNMVGAFYQPRLVYMNLSVLKTLDERQYSSGMAEIIKHGLIKDASYFSWLQEHTEKIKERSLDAMEEMITVSCQIKGGVVERDQKEQGERALLNFGHTLGHAIEKQMDFKLTHGECVALGSIAAAHISRMRGNISEEEETSMIELLEKYSLPAKIADLPVDEIIETTKSDKKMEAGKIKFVLLHQIGDAYTDKTVTDDEMRCALEFIMSKKGKEKCQIENKV